MMEVPKESSVSHLERGEKETGITHKYSRDGTIGKLVK